MTLFLRQSTSVDIRVGPFVDATDAVTPETGITLGAADQAEVLKADGAATVTMGGAFGAITGADGWYDYTVATGDVDTVGEVEFVVQDSSVCLPVYVRAMVVEEAVFDNLYAASAVGPLTAAQVQTECDSSLATYDGPTDTEMIARTLPTASYFDPAADAVANVTLVATTTVNSDMVAEAPTVNQILDETLTSHVTADSVAVAIKDTLADTGELQGDDVPGLIAALNDVAVTDIVSAGAITTSSGAVSTVTTVGTTTTNSDMVAEAPTAAANADAVWDELTTDHIAVNSFGQRLSVLETGTAVAASGTTITLDGGSSELADFYNGTIIVITAGTGVGQSRIISDYAVTTNVATVDTWITTPSTDSVYYIIPFGTIPGASAPTAGQVADAVWDELLAGHVVSDSTGELLNEWQDGGRLDVILDARMAEASIDTTGGAIDVVTLVDTTTANTDMRGTDSAATATSLATAQLDLDTITDTDGVILGAAGVDLIWDEPLTGATHNVTQSSGKRLRALGGLILHEGIAQAGSASTITLDTGASALDDFYNHAVIDIQEGTGAEQSRVITDYDGTTKVATIAPDWITNPASGSEFDIASGSVHTQTTAGGYDGGAIWLGPSGSTGTQLFVDGVITNPIDNASIANARIVADAVMLQVYHSLPGTSLTLDQTYNSWEFIGAGYSVNMNSQDVGGSRFISGAISGTGTGSSRVVLRDCIVPSAMSISVASFLGCQIAATVTMTSANGYVFDNCFSGPSAGLDFSSALNQSVRFEHWSGDLELFQMGVGGTDEIHIHGIGDITINANCTGGTVHHTGGIAITDNSGGAVTTVLIPTSTNVIQIDDSETAATNLSKSALGIVPGLCEGTPSTTVIQTDLAEATDDHYIGRIVVFTSGDAAGEATDITDYTGASGTITVTALTTAPAVTDAFVIV